MNAKDPRNEVVAKALKDPAFRAELKKDAKAAIEKTLGIKLPRGMTVKVVEDTGSTVHLVLPSAGVPLSDKDLAEVSGGGKGVLAPVTSPDYCNSTMDIGCR